MGISIRNWFLGSKKKNTISPVDCKALFEDAVKEYKLRELAFNSCVNMIANAVSKCTFKTYRNKEEVQGSEYYLWNIEPNANQNSTVFLHKLIYQLYRHNEALVISSISKNGKETLAVADEFDIPDEYPVKMQSYENVVVGEVEYKKTFKENEVLHFKLNNENIKPVLDQLTDAYARMLYLGIKSNAWAQGKHMKVHVDSVALGVDGDGEDWQKTFSEMLSAQVKPFMESDFAVLPEFNGYNFEHFGRDMTAERSTRDVKALSNDVFEFTARAFGIPYVLISGEVADTQDAINRWLTTSIDPLCDQIQEEIVRKRYGFDEWRQGNYLRIDTSGILHFDIFAQAANIEKLIGSGAFSINSVLAAAGQTPIDEPWADVHFMTKNFATVDSQLEALKGGE